MGLKEKMLERIEKNSIKINVNGEKIYLKKSGLVFKEWHVIYPPINPENEKWDFINLIFGGKSEGIKFFLIGILVLGFAYGISKLLNITLG